MACDWCDAQDDTWQDSSADGSTYDSGYDYGYAGPDYGYGYGYDNDSSNWSQYSTWSSGEVYGDGSSSFYSNYGGTDSTYGYVGSDGDMIINAGGETWWPGK